MEWRVIRQQWRFYGLASLLLATLLLTYSNHFQNSFQFDDSHTIENNRAIRSLSNIPRFFVDPATFSTLPANRSYRPLFTTLNAIDYWLAGGKLDVFYFHLSIFASYVLLVFFLYFFFLKFFDDAFGRPDSRFLALLTAGFFSLHTANAETINYVSARSDSFSTLMVIAAFISYMYLPTWRRYHLYLIPFAAGFLVKEPAIMFTALLLLYVLLFREKADLSGLLSTANRRSLVQAVKSLWPTIAGTLILYGFYAVMAPSTLYLGNTPRLNYLATQTFVVAHYLYSFVLPIKLSADTDWTYFENLADDRVISGCLLILALLVVAFRLSRKRETRPIAFGILWFFLALLPTSSVIPLSEVLNDHRVFFPYIGLTLAAGATAGLLYRRYKPVFSTSLLGRSVLMVALAGILLGHAYGTHQRNKVWRNDETLWRDVTIKSPQNGRGHMNYGLSQMANGRYQEALDAFQRAEELTPYYSRLHTNLGILHSAMGNMEEARRYFENGIRYGGGDPAGHYYYGRWLSEQKEYEASLSQLRKVLQLSPDHSGARSLLTLVEGMVDGTRSRVDDALKAVEESPSASNYIALSLAYYNEGQFEACIEACRLAIQQDPNSHLAYNNICSAYNELGQFDKAIEACEQALQINPNFEFAINNLKWAREQLQR